MTHMGHNSTPVQLEMAAADARKALGQVERADDDKMVAWVTYGAALLVGKKLTENPDCGVEGNGSDQRFGEWKRLNKLFDRIGGAVNHIEEQAAMWAAEDTERFEQAKADYPGARTVRGIHAKWKSAQVPDPEPTPQPTPQPIEDMNKTLKKLIPSSAEICAASDYIDGKGGQEDLAEAYGLKSRRELRDAVPYVLGIRESVTNPQVNPEDLSETAQTKLVRAERQLEKQFELRVEKRARELSMERFQRVRAPEFIRELEDANHIVKNRKGLVTKKQYKLLRMALHPDRPLDNERQAEAFALFNSLTISLMDEEQNPISVSNIPTTPEELLRWMAQ